MLMRHCEENAATDEKFPSECSLVARYYALQARLLSVFRFS